MCRGTQLFRKLGVPILGMVENMSFHVCSACGHKEFTFGQDGVVRTAKEYGLQLLGQVRVQVLGAGDTCAWMRLVAGDWATGCGCRPGSGSVCLFTQGLQPGLLSL